MNEKLKEYYAKEFVKYITKRNASAQYRTTLADVCKRFRFKQKEAIDIISYSDNLILTDLAYVPVNADDNFGTAMLKSWHPQIWEDAPSGSRIVAATDWDWKEKVELYKDKYGR